MGVSKSEMSQSFTSQSNLLPAIQTFRTISQLLSSDRNTITKRLIATLINMFGEFLNKVDPEVSESIKREITLTVVSFISPLVTQLTSLIMSNIVEFMLLPFSSPILFSTVVLLPLLWSGLLLYTSISSFDAVSFTAYPLEYSAARYLQIYLLIDASSIIADVLVTYILSYPTSRYLQKHVPEVSGNPFRFISDKHTIHHCMWNFRTTSRIFIQVIRIGNLIYGIVCFATQTPMVFLILPLFFFIPPFDLVSSL